MYGKIMVRSKKYHAHNEGNAAKAGDLVEIIEETRPVSTYQDLGCDERFAKGYRRITKVFEFACAVVKKAGIILLLFCGSPFGHR
jgi:hypothetical protein